MHTIIRKCTWSQVFFLVAILLVGCQIAIPKTEVSGDQNPKVSEVKLVIEQPGMYRLNSEDLAKAGLVVEQPSQLKMMMGGQPIPFLLAEKNGGFELIFYGMLPNSQYANHNVYWLSTGGTDAISHRMLSETAFSNIANAKDHYLTRQVLEEKRIFSPLIHENPWYWFALPAPDSRSLEVQFNGLAPGSGVIAIDVWGATKSPSVNDHHLKVLINDTLVIDEWWDGAGFRQLEARIPDGIMRSGKNNVKLEAPGDTGAVADNVYIQKIEFQFQQRVSSSRGQIFIIGEGKQIRLEKLHQPLSLYDITLPDQPVYLHGEHVTNGSITFLGDTDHQYVLVSENGYLTPDIQQPFQSSVDFKSTPGADYIVIGPSDLLEPLTPLLGLRQAQGLETGIYPLEAIYDAFNFGLPEPEAIHRFIASAFQHWLVKPKYVLLVGDASYDPLAYLGDQGSNQLPIYFVTTQYGGLTGSDLPYVDLDADNKPELAVGRVPARTPEEVQTWVEKTIAYEQALETKTSFRALAIADGQEVSFRNDAQKFLDDIGHGYQVELYAPEANVSNATADITSFFQSGFQLIGYFGHGSVNMWGRDRLFSIDDVPMLRQEYFPIVFTMTCLNGFFIHPTTTSLAEAMIFSRQGGAVAVLAPTSLTTAIDQSIFGANLYPRLAEPGVERLGDLLLVAQRLMPQTMSSHVDVLLTFLLFGDPALRLRIAQ